MPKLEFPDGRPSCLSVDRWAEILSRRDTSRPELEPSLLAHLRRCPACRRALRDGIAPDEVAATDAASRSVGAVLGRFTITGLLGIGGMGIVYLAHDGELDREVALKVPLCSVPGPDVHRLAAEARMMARLNHPNIVTIFEVGYAGDQVFFAMEYVRGTTLHAWLRAGARSAREVLDVFAAAGEGLAAAHRCGVIHGDFKPFNVLVGEDGRVRVSDFGLASCRGGVSDAATTRGGTVRYAAPERLRGGDVSESTDTYSFGVCLFEALVGSRPGDVEPRRARRSIPPAVRRALLAATGTDPQCRRLLPLLAAMNRARASGGRRLWGGVLAVAAGGAALASALAISNPSSCKATGEELTGIWDRDRAGSIHAAFSRVSPPIAASFFEATRTRLDGYAERWRSSYAQACATSGPDATVQQRCLELARTRLGTVVDALQIDPETMMYAVDIVETLPPPARCRQPRPLDTAALSSDTIVLEQQVRSALAASRPAETDALELVRRTETEHDPGGRVRARLLLAEAYEQALQPGKAEQELRSAATLAIEAADPSLQSQAWLRLAENLGLDQGRFEDAVALLDVAEAAAANTGQARGELHRVRARLWTEGGRYQACAEDAVQALTADEAEVPAIPSRVLDDLDILSLCLHADGRPRQSEPYAARAVEMAAALYGPQHPRYARALRTFGLVLSILEDPRGLDAMREAVVIYDALGATAGWTGPAAMQARNNLASALRMRGAHGEAIEHRRRVLAEVQALPTLSPRHVRTRLLLSIDLIAAGRLDEAEPVLRRAEQDLSRLPQRNRHLEAGIAVHQAVIAEHERRLPDAQRHYARAAALLDGLAQRGDPTLAFCRASAAWLGSSLDDPRSRETLIAAVEGSDDLDDPCLGGQILSRAGWSLRAHDPIRAARWAREGETLLQKVPQLDCDPIRALVL